VAAGTFAAAFAAAALALPLMRAGAQVGTCEVRGYGVDDDRQGAPTNMRVSRNAPCWFDLRFGADGLILSTEPEHGRVELEGTRVTYTPVHQFVGEDHFVLQSRGAMSTTTGRRRPNMMFSVAVLVTR
jgi:hypothetical protein